MADNEAIIRRILEPVGKPVAFNYPDGEKDLKGTLKDRAVIKSNTSSNGVQYWDVVDLIEFTGCDEPDWIRIGYYRQIGEILRWASQTTITEPIRIWKKLLTEAAIKAPWFRELILEVAEELRRVR